MSAPTTSNQTNNLAMDGVHRQSVIPPTSSREAGRAVNCLGTQQLRAPFSQQPTAKEFQVAQVLEAAKELAVTRGQLLAEIFGSSGDALSKLNTKLTALDANFGNSLAQHREIFAGQPEAIAAVAQSVRVAQSQALYAIVRQRCFELGVELGESQGRHVAEDRLVDILKKVEGFKQLVEMRLESAEKSRPASAAEGDPSTSSFHQALRDALDASVRQGERVGIDRRIEAEVDAAEVYRTIAGWKEFLPSWFTFFKPFHVVHSILAGQSKEQLDYIDQSIREMRGIGLRDALCHAYGKQYQHRIDWLVEGDQVGLLATQAAFGLREFFSTRNSRSEGLRLLYRQVPLESFARFESLLSQELGISSESLRDYLASRITGPTMHKIEALRNNDHVLERVLHIEDLICSGRLRQLELRKIFREILPEEVVQLKERYYSCFGTSLRDDLYKHLRASPVRDLCIAVLDNDAERALAAKVRCAFAYRADFIAAPFLNTSEEEREVIRTAYEKHYCSGRPDLLKDLRKASWREDYFFLAYVPLLPRLLEPLYWPCMNSYPFLESIVLNGKLSPAELLRYFMVGIGVDTLGIRAVSYGWTKREAAQIKADYARRYAPGWITRLLARQPIIAARILTGDLDHDTAVELSGDDEFDVSLYLEGLPETDDEREMCKTLLDRLDRRFSHEQSGPLMRLRQGLLSHLRGDRKIVQQFLKDYTAALRYYEEAIAGAPQLTAERIKRFSTLVRLAETQADAYRQAKVAISNLVLNSGAAIGATAGAMSVILISALPWWTGPIAAGLGSLVWRWGQGRLVLGKGFGTTDATFQACRAFIDGASMFTIKLGIATLSGLLGRQLSSAAAKGGFKTTLHRVIKSIEDGIKRQNKARHVLEQGKVMKSDAELEALTRGFYQQIEDHPRALHADDVVGAKSIAALVNEALSGAASSSCSRATVLAPGRLRPAGRA
jgi:hypothetical protein